VTERHRSRNTGLAWEDLPPILRGEHAEIEDVALEPVAFLDHLACELRQTEGLGHFAGTGLIVAGGAAHE
jgi:hypothetical protein